MIDMIDLINEIIGSIYDILEPFSELFYLFFDFTLGFFLGLFKSSVPRFSNLGFTYFDYLVTEVNFNSFDFVYMLLGFSIFLFLFKKAWQLLCNVF